jgi:hypothetical protein
MEYWTHIVWLALSTPISFNNLLLDIIVSMVPGGYQDFREVIGHSFSFLQPELNPSLIPKVLVFLLHYYAS